MSVRKYRALASVLTIMALIASIISPVWAAEPDAQGGWTLDLKDVEIRAFIEQVSGITGETFVVDPAVTGKITVITGRKLSAQAVRELFLSVLRGNGVAAIPSGPVTRIVPIANTKSGSLVGSTAQAGGQQIITRVLPVKHASVEDAVRGLKPLVSPAGYIEGSPQSRTLIVTDYADNIQQITTALRGLDSLDTGQVEVIPLQHGLVANVAPLIEALSPSELADEKTHAHLRIVGD